MADKLIVDDSQGHDYRISWYLEEEQEIGGSLGDGAKKYTDKQIEADIKEGGDAHHQIATNAVAGTKNAQHDSRGYYWESRADAKAALAAALAAIKVAESKVSWPTWAETALANGWKAPKGWKP